MEGPGGTQQGAGDWLQLCLKSCLKPQAGRAGRKLFLPGDIAVLRPGTGQPLPSCVYLTPQAKGVGSAGVFSFLSSFFFFCLSCSFGVLWAIRACPLLKGLGHRVLGTTWTGCENEEEESGITPDPHPPPLA